MKYRVQNEVAAQMNSWRARRHMNACMNANLSACLNNLNELTDE